MFQAVYGFSRVCCCQQRLRHQRPCKKSRIDCLKTTRETATLLWPPRKEPENCWVYAGTWNDSRLRFNGTEDGGCEDKLHYTVDAGQPPKLWVPDVYFENARQNHLGLPNDGTLLESYPDGGVFMSQRLRLTVNCAMNLGRLPWDRQICGVNVGVFSETAKQVQLAWTSKNVEGALANLDWCKWVDLHPQNSWHSRAYKWGNQVVRTFTRSDLEINTLALRHQHVGSGALGGADLEIHTLALR